MSTLPAGTAVHVRVPASSANLGPGFDSVGLALGVWDEVTVTVTDHGGLVVDVEGEGAADVPRDAEHLVVRSLVAGLASLDVPVPEHLHLRAVGRIPHGRGLGSSASAIVAGVAAAHALVAATGGAPYGDAVLEGDDLALDLAAVADLASRLEGHPDNATASVYGGLTVSWTADPGDPREGRTATARVAVGEGLDAVVLVPTTRLATHTARAVLPATVAHHEAAQQAGRAALLALAVTGRPELLLPATRDWLHQEQRRPAFAATMALVDDLRARGHAAVVSGAGPAVLVLTPAAATDDVTCDDPAWRRIVPGVPTTGVHARRVLA
ncbi:homoserine kinase [Lapillicoccus jejuensis]|uniref:Homoserine kinase n=1 Tax=Lapillicoccus jejuensis TaxID=402171 RepID=A0A542E2P9_9MICO|nr:homoserine kinase [Lapillicoccus jejuensis]TQJ09608.1 homoserine kinase [Lapillicoccus jejuensis]